MSSTTTARDPLDSEPAANAQRPVMVGLLDVASGRFTEDLYARLSAEGFGDVRPGHGCVFGTIDPEGSRLTVLAARARMTKQTVGEVTNDLERLGYVERRPDPEDGRAKIICLTERGRAVRERGRELIDETEAEWARRYGAETMRALREALEIVTADWWAEMFPQGRSD
jgi:DNA-binding MarR family transcriptional regulator